MSNKVQYGLKNVHYATLELDANNAPTFGTPVAWPGAVTLTMDAAGEVTRFRADNLNYWIGQSNNGYSGNFESALVPDSFKTDILGFVADKNGVLVEDAEAQTKPFALLFEFKGDEFETRHVLYHCTASRPSVSGQTTEEQITPTTESISIETGTVYSSALGKNIQKASAKKADTPYATWFSQVYLPVAPTT